MKKVINRIVKNKLILGIIIGISLTSTVVYAAYIEAREVSFTSNTGLTSSNVQDAIDELNNKCSSNNSSNNGSGSNQTAKTYKCKRATTLHTTQCLNSYEWGTSKFDCEGSGYSSGSTITYGNLGTNGTLSAGDAFDCDVNGDGTYDSNAERFYYVSDYYDTSSKTFNNSVATLIYYSNVSGGVANNSEMYQYDTNGNSGENWHGPEQTAGKAYYQLPSTSQWNNVSLYKSTRAILNENGQNTTNGGTLPSNYSYSAKSARFLTVQELLRGCNISTINYKDGELNECQYLMENTSFQDRENYSNGYWLETPMSNGITSIFGVNGEYRRVREAYAAQLSIRGTRPVIEVLKSDIDY